MDLIWSDEAWDDYLWCQRDARLLKRANQLIEDIKRSPFEGIGKPEPLKYQMSGYWSRRITEEHRIVYKPVDGAILIAQCRFHY